MARVEFLAIVARLWDEGASGVTAEDMVRELARLDDAAQERRIADYLSAARECGFLDAQGH